MKDMTVIEDGKKWVFDKNVTSVFDDMLNRSIPDYKTMREVSYELGTKFVKPGTYIVDIGCSNGNAIAPFIEKYGEDNRYMLCDCSEPMIEQCKNRYESYEYFNCIEIEKRDIAKDFPKVDASLVLSIFTIQFTPIEYRKQILKNIYDALEDGGALIIAEKVIGETAKLDDIIVESYYDMKRKNGYTEEQIQTKRKSLEGVLVPVTAHFNEELLESAGFRQVDRFWQCLNFAGWVAVK